MYDRQRTLYQLIGSLFEVGQDTISPDLQIGDVPLWDSLGHAKLMLAVEDEFEIEINADEVADVQSVQDLESLIQRKLPGNGSP